MTVAEIIVRAVELYGLAGIAVAAVFLLFGIDRVDPCARGAYMVRPLLAPGVVVLWPLVLARWLRLERGSGAIGHRRLRRTAHARIWTVLAVLIPVMLLTLLTVRQTVPADRPAVAIEADAR